MGNKWGQVPVLFTGTLRSNLTPFGEHSDAECWAALRRAHLAPAIEAQAAGLDLLLTEGGAPLSAGQKQLVALARALLRHSKVLFSSLLRGEYMHERTCMVACLSASVCTGEMCGVCVRFCVRVGLHACIGDGRTHTSTDVCVANKQTAEVNGAEHVAVAGSLCLLQIRTSARSC